MANFGFREERMGPHMLKIYLEGLPGGCVVHHFTDADTGDPHDHPWDFYSHILFGGYVERVYFPNGGWQDVTRNPGDAFFVPRGHIHRIVRLLEGDCWTIITPRGEPSPVHFYQWDENGYGRRRLARDGSEWEDY